MYFKFGDNKHVVSCKELCTPVNTAVSEDFPTGTNTTVIDLLCHTTGTKFSQQARFSETKYSPVSAFWIFRNSEILRYVKSTEEARFSGSKYRPLSAFWISRSKKK